MVDDVGSGHVDKVDCVDEVVGEVKDLKVVCIMNDVVDEGDAVPEGNQVVG